MGLESHTFSLVDAIRHLERVHGAKVTCYRFGTAYYTGEPRMYCNLLGASYCDQWLNPSLDWQSVSRLFFPDDEPVSSMVDIFSGNVTIVHRTSEKLEKE